MYKYHIYIYIYIYEVYVITSYIIKLFNIMIVTHGLFCVRLTKGAWKGSCLEKNKMKLIGVNNHRKGQPVAGRQRGRAEGLYIPQRGVQWKQGVVICMMSYTISLYDTTPIHCTPILLPTAPL